MLALHANETVSRERLVDGLWGRDPPATASKMVQLYVSQLRRLLVGDESAIVTHGRGYELRMPDGTVDAARFERLVEHAGEAEPAANGSAREALALWRGAALADVAEEPFAAPEIRRLDDLRLRAAELAIETDLAVGRHEQVIPELERLIDEHPLREHLHAQRMLALYRAGRQAEALAAYVAARRRLVEDVGVEPGAELRALHERILGHDPSLLAPHAPHVPERPGDGPPPPSRTAPVPGPARAPPAHTMRHRIRRRDLAVAAAVAALITAGVLAVRILSGPDRLPGVDENRVGVIDPGASGVIAQYPVGREPTALAAGGGSVWAANAGDGTVSRIRSERDPVVTIPVGEDPAGVAYAAGSLWVTDREDRAVVQVNPETNRVGERIDVGNAPSGIAASLGSLWVASEVDRTITRVDLADGSVARKITLGASPTAVAAGPGAVWVASEEGGTVFRIEPRSGVVLKSIPVGNGPIAIAADEDAVWVANRQDRTVSRIDPATDAVTDAVRVGRDPSAIAVGAGAVWVANGGDGTVSRIDSAAPARIDTIDVAGSPSALTIADGLVWTAALASPASHRGGTLRVAMVKKHFGCCFAPAIPFEYAAASLVYDGLLAYRRAGGSTYGRLVGNLATDVPEPSPDGRTYVLRLRRGIRYSDGTLVRPEDFRASMEHQLRAGWTLQQGFYGRIVGAPDCAADRASCELSDGIETDAEAGTITIHLTEPDPEFLHKLAHPLAWLTPAGQPFRLRTPPPGTGPYRLAGYDTRSGARLVRNPHFSVWSPDARPDGFADEVVFTLGSINGQVAAVQRGHADAMQVNGLFGGPVEPSRIRALAVRHAARLHTTATPQLAYMWLNTRAPPFDDVDVRRALNYAVDRDEIGRIAGGPDIAQPTCQIVPAGFPGYAPSCRYTTNPSPAAGWSGPDLVRAHRLIERSGTRGMRVTVWTYEGKRAFAGYFVSLLRSLGYRSRLRVYKEYLEGYRFAVADSRTRAQIGIEGWAPDFGVAAQFTPQFRCDAFVPRSETSGNLAEFCDPGIDARIEDAHAAAPEHADRIWHDVYRRLADAAPAVPLVNDRNVTFVSERVGNYQHHPMVGPLFDQMWVR